MEYGICNLSIAPMRNENSHKSELISQLLYGDCFKVISKKNEWLQITTITDDYSGWIDYKQTQLITKSEAEDISFTINSYSSSLVDYIETSENKLISLVLGSNVGATKFLGHGFKGSIIKGKKPKSNLLKIASLYLHSPYLWGGKTPMGIDCSGLIQMIYRINGYNIPRDAAQQVKLGETLSFIDESEVGDLAFFDDEDDNIIHVGLLLGNNYILHAHGEVRIDRIDQTGIYNVKTKRHSHNLRIIKKLI
ncbi:MAG: NlpC/P60 family protein [Flavobacteriaceae bacterium]